MMFFVSSSCRSVINKRCYLHQPYFIAKRLKILVENRFYCCRLLSSSLRTGSCSESSAGISNVVVAAAKATTTTTTSSATLTTLANNKKNHTSHDASSSSSSVIIDKPTTRQLSIVAMRSGIPMIGFGFMDNLVMIQAGEAIDASIGVTFGLATLTAAGFGQCFSDVAGLTCGGIVDAIVNKLNIPHHGLSPDQLDMKHTRIISTIGGCIGVVTGCLLGMTSLFFMDLDKTERAKKAQELNSIFQTVIEESYKLVNAERATLWLHDEEDHKDELWSKVALGTDEIIKVSIARTNQEGGGGGGIVGECFREGKVMNIKNVSKSKYFNPNVDAKTGYKTKSILTVPIIDKHNGNKVLGAIQFLNKKKPSEQQQQKQKKNNHEQPPNTTTTTTATTSKIEDIGFDDGDVKVAKMLASHISSFIRIVTA